MAKKTKESRPLGREFNIKNLKKTILESADVNTRVSSFEIRLDDFELGEVDEVDEFDEDYVSQSHTEEISFIELGILNEYLYDAYKGKHKNISVGAYGQVDGIGQLSFGGPFDVTGQFWFSAKFENNENA